MLGSLPAMSPPPLREQLHPSWAHELSPVADTLASLDSFLLSRDAAGSPYLPRYEQVLRAFTTPLDAVRVLLVGQDPYPTPGHAVGLSFSVAPGVRPLPGSLRNIVRELVDDLGTQAAPDVGTRGGVDGDLSPWFDQGVLLLNRVLTVAPGAAGSHRGRGWEQVTDQAITALVARGGPLVAVLWGRDAQTLADRLAGVALITSAHPSPLSARRGFFGSRPFSRANALLTAQGAPPIDWTLPSTKLPPTR